MCKVNPILQGALIPNDSNIWTSHGKFNDVYSALSFFLKCDLIFQEENRGYKEDSVKQKYAANQIEQQELKKEG